MRIKLLWFSNYSPVTIIFLSSLIVIPVHYPPIKSFISQTGLSNFQKSNKEIPSFVLTKKVTGLRLKQVSIMG